MLLYLTIAPIIGMVYPIIKNILKLKKKQKYIKGDSLSLFLKKINKRKKISYTKISIATGVYKKLNFSVRYGLMRE